MFRNAILDAAEQVFAEKGFHVARIQDVAHKARIGVGTVYNHFEQKEDLLRALLEERTEQMIARLVALPSDPEPFEERLAARLGRMLGYVEQHRSFIPVAVENGVFGKSTPSGDQICAGRRMAQLERFRGSFRALIEEGVAAGALEPMEPQRLVWALAGILRMFIHGALEQQAPSLTPLAPVITDLFLHGAARRSPASPPPATPKKTVRRARRPAR